MPFLFSTISFPIIILACGHYVRDYNLEGRIEKTFDQHFIGTEKTENCWMNVHEKDGRLLLHTRHLAMCPDATIKDIADKVRDFMKKENI